ncbi:MAG TPA: SDR family NAD(P)-dependent oxidoreductase [Gemmatimonadales bacterium]
MSTAFDLGGQVAVVTGVGRVGQIGHAVAEGFIRAGAKLVISDKNAVGVAARAKEFASRGADVRAAAGDLTEPDVAHWIIEQAMQNFGRVDILVNVAGGLTGIAPMTEAGEDVIDREIAINLKTMYLVSRAAAKVMVPRKSGAIVSFASMAAIQARPAMAAYSAAKAGVAALTRSLALELRDANVRVNAVAPGTVRTGDNRASMGDTGSSHWVEIADIVNAVLFLSSDAAAGITGHVLPVSRGED